MLITNRKHRQKMKKDKLLDLYADDFAIEEWWKQVCDSLGVDHNKTDKVTISYNKVIINN